MIIPVLYTAITCIAWCARWSVCGSGDVCGMHGELMVRWHMYVVAGYVDARAGVMVTETVNVSMTDIVCIRELCMCVPYQHTQNASTVALLGASQCGCVGGTEEHHVRRRYASNGQRCTSFQKILNIKIMKKSIPNKVETVSRPAFWLTERVSAGRPWRACVHCMVVSTRLTPRWPGCRCYASSTVKRGWSLGMHWRQLQVSLGVVSAVSCYGLSLLTLELGVKACVRAQALRLYRGFPSCCWPSLRTVISRCGGFRTRCAMRGV